MKEHYYLASLSSPNKIIAIVEMTPLQKLQRNAYLREENMSIRWASLKHQAAAHTYHDKYEV